MYVIDASEPLRPTQAAFLATGDSTSPFGPFRDIQIAGNTLYAADEFGLIVIDLSNPRQPRQLGFARLIDWPVTGSSNPVVGVAVANGLAYVTANDGLKIVDVSDPTKPAPVAVYRGSRHNGGAITISGGLAYMSHGGGTDVLSLANPRQPVLVTDFDGLGETVQTKLQNGQLFAADESLGVGLMDLANPQQPRRLAWVNTAGYSQDVAVTSGLALVADTEGGDAEGGLAILGPSNSAPPPPAALGPRAAIAIPAGASPAEQPADARPPQIPPLAASANSLLVTSALDAGPGTLRAMIATAARGTIIRFDAAVFPPSNPATIQLLSALPTLQQGGVVIDASNAGVILDGRQTGNASGITINSDGNAVLGLQIFQFGGAGISVTGAGNRLGGPRDQGTGPVGQGNVIGNCGRNGIDLFGPATTNNVVAGNLIGLGLRDEPLPNQNGVNLSGAAHANLLGGSSAAERNIISANRGAGISILLGAHDNVVVGNFIGPTRDGAKSAGTQQYGVNLQSPRNRRRILSAIQCPQHPVPQIL